MESPHLYENIEYKKDCNMKTKPLYPDVSDYDINSELANNEVSLNLHNLIDDQHSLMSDSLISDLQGLNVDKSSLAAVNCPRGIGANPGMGCLPQSVTTNNNNMYNALAYVPQPVHGGSQYERPYDDRLAIKEEPYENSPDSSHDYPSCARMNYSGYGAGYPMASSVITSSDSSVLKSPHKSHSSMVKAGQKKIGRNDDEYRKRRERNNIAVRKSREKAKLRTRETEERVKLLNDENRNLKDQCKSLTEEVNLFKSVFSSMQLECLPEPFQSEFRKSFDKIITNHPHTLIGI